MRMFALAAFLTLSCAGCNDDVTGPHLRPPSGGARLHGAYICSVDVVERRTSCAPQIEKSGAGGPALTIIKTPVMVEAQLSNESYDPADSLYRADVRIINRMAVPIGTPDGTTISGVKAFFVTTPRVTQYRSVGNTAPPVGRETPLSMGDTGVVRVRNADGYQAFTAANQPYFSYAQIIDSDWFSEDREWQWTVPANVAKFDFTVSVFAVVPGEVQIPVPIPRSWQTPGRYYEPANRGFCGFGGAGPCVYDVVTVGFHDHATQEERQAALNAVDGVLDGGTSATNRYFFRLPHDTTFAVMKAALGKLRALPQVEFATPYDLTPVSLDYLRPVDGSGWSDWRVNDSLTSDSRRNWSLEAISAPLAWGCDTGVGSGRVAVVDTDFHEPGDLLGHLVNGTGSGLPIGTLTLSADTVDHGTRVASIIAAGGNNSTGMTGVLWGSTVQTYEIAVFDSAQGMVYRSNGEVILDPERALTQMVNAALEGASVINMSIGTNWDAQGYYLGYIQKGGSYDPALESNPQRIARNDSVRIERWRLMKRALLEIRSKGKNPLIVLSAGNNETSTNWNGFATAADSFPGNVLVVAAAEDAGSGRLRPMHVPVTGQKLGTNYGPQVQIAAPGNDVWMLNRNSQVKSSGTSFAAPLVSGVAGLLLSFDPRLEQKADTLKQLILEGARIHGRRVRNGAVTDSIPVLNAYESLRAAAGRRGAPLCGNQIWTHDKKSVFVQRADGPEQIITNVSGASVDVYGVDALHGGRDIRVSVQQPTYANTEALYRYDPATAGWSQQGPLLQGWRTSVAGSSGAYLSAMGLSHDRDTAVVGEAVGYQTGMIDINLQLPGGSKRLVKRLAERVGTGSAYWVCLEREIGTTPSDTSGTCHKLYFFSEGNTSVGWYLSYGQARGHVVAVANRYTSYEVLHHWQSCPWLQTPRHECRGVSAIETDSSSTAHVLRISDGAEVAKWSVQAILTDVSVHEVGSELNAERTVRITQREIRPVTTTPSTWSSWSLPTEQYTCQVQALELMTGSRVAQVPEHDCSAVLTGLTAAPIRSPRR